MEKIVFRSLCKQRLRNTIFSGQIIIQANRDDTCRNLTSPQAASKEMESTL